MVEKILSQEEIDALYSAMAEGPEEEEGGTISGETEEEVVPYDFHVQVKRPGERFDVLNEVCHRFAVALKEILASRMRATIDVDYVGTEMRKFGDFLKEFTKPTNFNIFNMEPFRGSALLVIVDALAFSIIDCVFGGTGKPVPQMRDFTLIEQRVLRRLVVDILKHLEKSWEVVHHFRFLYRKMESNPDFIQVIGPADQVVVMSFFVNADEYSGNLHVCIPFQTLEPIKEKLSYRNLREMASKSMPDPRLKNMLRQTDVTLAVELGTSTHTIRELLDLDVGDIIQLDTGIHDTVSIRVEEVVKYRGLPGVSRGNRAVRITTYHDSKTEA